MQELLFLRNLTDATMPSCKREKPLCKMTVVIEIETEEKERLIFENHTEMNRELYFEAAATRGSKWKVRIFVLIGIVLLFSGIYLTDVPIIVLSIVVIALALFSHVIIAYRDFGKLKRFYPTGTWTKTVRFYEDHIETDSGIGAVTRATYKDIRKETETKHMYVIEFTREFPATTFRKDGFTEGSFEEFKSFLTERQRAEYEPAGEDENG